MSTTCYLCDAVATTTEHVPAKVFFPEMKDLGAQYGDLRKQLVTVPACATHNNAFSKDDEYVAIVIAMSASNEPIGADHFTTKFVRTLTASPRFKDMFERHMTPILLDAQESAQLKLDRARYAGVIDRIARGLYRHEANANLAGQLFIDSPALGPPAEAASFRTAQRHYPADLSIKTIGGESVFTYALRREPFFLHLKFYGGFDVFVTPHVQECLAIEPGR